MTFTVPSAWNCTGPFLRLSFTFYSSPQLCGAYCENTSLIGVNWFHQLFVFVLIELTVIKVHDICSFVYMFRMITTSCVIPPPPRPEACEPSLQCICCQVEMQAASNSRSLTGSKARLLFPLSEVRVGVEVWLQSGRCVDGLAPAFPLYQMGHSALSHGCRFCHMVLHYLGNTYRGKAQSYAAACLFNALFYSILICLMLYSPCREDRANAAISWMVRARLDFGNISMVSSTFTWKDKKRGDESESRGKTGRVAQLCMTAASQFILLWLTGKPSVVFSRRRNSFTSAVSVYFKALESKGFFFFTQPKESNTDSHTWARTSRQAHGLCFTKSSTS